MVGENIDDVTKKQFEEKIQNSVIDAIKKRENLINWIKKKSENDEN